MTTQSLRQKIRQLTSVILSGFSKANTPGVNTHMCVHIHTLTHTCGQRRTIKAPGFLN